MTARGNGLHTTLNKPWRLPQMILMLPQILLGVPKLLFRLPQMFLRWPHTSEGAPDASGIPLNGSDTASKAIKAS